MTPTRELRNTHVEQRVTRGGRTLTSRVFRRIGDLLAPGGHRGTLAVLIYHRVLPAPDPILQGETDVASFEQHMALLAAEFNVLPLGEAHERLACGALPARAVCITFDDGYADNEEIALPVLKRLGLPATFFIATGYSSGGMMFNDTIYEAIRRAAPGRHDLHRLGLGEIDLSDDASRRAVALRLIYAVMHRHVDERQRIVETLAEELGSAKHARLMMTAAQIANLHREGMEIGAHTVRHPILTAIPEEDARTEIVHSKRALEEITGSPVALFAYPHGKPERDYDARHVRLVKEAGFSAAVSTTPGVAHRGSDRYQLPRFSAWERSPRRVGMRLLVTCARTAVA